MDKKPVALGQFQPGSSVYLPLTMLATFVETAKTHVPNQVTSNAAAEIASKEAADTDAAADAAAAEAEEEGTRRGWVGVTQWWLAAAHLRPAHDGLDRGARGVER